MHVKWVSLIIYGYHVLINHNKTLFYLQWFILTYKTGSLWIPSTNTLPCFLVFEKYIFEADASLNVNTLRETKNENVKIKTNNMNNGANVQPISLKNEANPDATFLVGATPVPTAGAASTIIPDAHIPPSGHKKQTKPFYQVNMKEMSKKDTIETTPAHQSPTAVPAYAPARSPGSTVSNSPYSLRNHYFPVSSISSK